MAINGLSQFFSYFYHFLCDKRIGHAFQGDLLQSSEAQFSAHNMMAPIQSTWRNLELVPLLVHVFILCLNTVYIYILQFMQDISSDDVKLIFCVGVKGRSSFTARYCFIDINYRFTQFGLNLVRKNKNPFHKHPYGKKENILKEFLEQFRKMLHFFLIACFDSNASLSSIFIQNFRCLHTVYARVSNI